MPKSLSQSDRMSNGTHAPTPDLRAHRSRCPDRDDLPTLTNFRTHRRHHGPRFHSPIAGRNSGQLEGLPRQVGHLIFLSKRPNPGLNPRSPPVSGGSAKIRGTQCHRSWSQPRHHRFPQRFLRQARTELQTSRRRRRQSRRNLRIAHQSGTREVCRPSHFSHRSSRPNRKVIHERESSHA